MIPVPAKAQAAQERERERSSECHHPCARCRRRASPNSQAANSQSQDPKTRQERQSGRRAGETGYRGRTGQSEGIPQEPGGTGGSREGWEPQEAQTSRLGRRRHLVPTTVGLIREQGEGRKPFTHSPAPVSSHEGLGPAIQPNTERPTEWGSGLRVRGAEGDGRGGGSVRMARGPSPTQGTRKRIRGRWSSVQTRSADKNCSPF